MPSPEPQELAMRRRDFVKGIVGTKEPSILADEVIE
jgi:hypothetical protein